MSLILVGVDHATGHTAVDHVVLTGDEARFRRGEEGYQGGDILRTADPADRRLSMIEPTERCILRRYPAGGDTVDPDRRAEADSQGVGEGGQTAFRGGVGLAVRLRLQGAGGGDIDDGTAAGTQGRD